MSPRLALAAIPVLALVAYACSSTVKGEKADEGTGGASEGGAAGSSSSGGGASGGATGDGGMGGQATGGQQGTGGVVQLPLGPFTNCADAVKPASIAPGDYACLDFDDGVIPSTTPWALSLDPDAPISITTNVAKSTPNAIRLGLPYSGVAGSSLSWSNIGGEDIQAVHMDFELNHNSLPAAPPPWEDPGKVACVGFGKIEACLSYAWGTGAAGMGDYLIQLTDNRTIPSIDTCALAMDPTPDSWQTITLSMAADGVATVTMEGGEAETCTAGWTPTGTKAEVSVGLRVYVDSAHGGYGPAIDNLRIMAERK
jgi:hypothetical protein